MPKKHLSEHGKHTWRCGRDRWIPVFLLCHPAEGCLPASDVIFVLQHIVHSATFRLLETRAALLNPVISHSLNPAHMCAVVKLLVILDLSPMFVSAHGLQKHVRTSLYDHLR